MRFLLRFVGLLCLAGAFAALVVDGTRSISAGHLELLSASASLGRLSPDALAGLHRSVAAKAPALWDPILVTILQLPTWVVLGVVGLVLVALARPGRQRIGYTRR